ncbi:fimbria/pilus outer membrane usher protein [Sphingomonas sp.]|uniref:fimbria/pilus outer membrane usher protein n=1 Tax=Sphingomonas sp. TaxID=28214 RepID=UPI003B003B99
MRALLFLALLLLPWAPAVAADDRAEARTAAALPTTLFVELVVNGQAGGALAGMVQDGERLLVDTEELRQAGIAVPQTGAVDVAHWPGVRATYDVAGQRLLIDVPPALLPTRRINAPTTDPTATLVDTGALLNYDLYVQRANRRTVASLWTEQRVFGRFGTIANTGIASTGSRRGYTRLDTRYGWVDEGRAIEVNAGDLITRALAWTGAVRIGGVQLARDFALRPDLITVPLPSFAGEAAVPTGVDLFINGYRQTSAAVAPGRFVLDSVPVVNGAGEARIVTTDAVGREIATVIPFYVAPELLRPGLTDFSIEAGVLRHGYGRSSFDYRRAVVSGSIRRGFSRSLTLSAHTEVTPGLVGAGAGAAWSPGRWGAVSGSLLVSRTARTTGTQVTAGYTYTSSSFSIGADHVERSGGFTDLGGFDLGRYAGSRRSDRVSVSMPVRGVGSLGAGYVSARQRDGLRFDLASVSLSLPLGSRTSAFVAVDHDLRRRFSMQARIVIPFGRSTIASAGVARDPDGGVRVQASAARSIPSDGGFGFATDLARTAQGRFLGQASAGGRGEMVQVDGGVASSGDATSVWGSVTGSLALMHGRVYAKNALPGSFAVVSTGLAGVPVYYENQPMGRTDRSGHLFVPNVTANHAGSFAIDPVRLPVGAIAERTETRAALRAGTGAVIDLPVRYHLSVTARLVDGVGAPLVPGTVATLNGQAKAIVGWDGVLLIEAMTGRIDVDARGADGRACHGSAEVPADTGPLADIGTVTCR